MIRASLICLIIAFCVTPALGNELPPLRWAADAEGGAPYITVDLNNPGKYIGFEVELAEALSNQLDRPIEFTQYNFNSLVPGLGRRDFDFAMNGLEVTPDRLKRVRFSRPYYIYTLQLVARRAEARFDSLDGCKTSSLIVGTLEDTAAERLLDREGITKRIYEDQVGPYRDLALGRIDAVLMDMPIAIYYAKPDDRLQLIGPPIEEGFYAIAFRQSDEELAQSIDAALQKLIYNGELKRIYEKWGLWNDHQLSLASFSGYAINSELGREWSPARYLPLLLEGAWMTIQLSGVGFLLAIIIGLPLAIARLYGGRFLAFLAVIYIEFFRGIPVLLLLFFLYYGLPMLPEYYGWEISLKMSAWQAAVLGFGLNYAAYEAEIYRAGIQAVPQGQWEAAAALGMGRFLTFRRIILPQAVRIILPPMTNDFVALFKDTSIVSIIAVVELSKQYQILSKESLMYVEIGLATAALYLLMSVPLGQLSRFLEVRWSTRL